LAREVAVPARQATTDSRCVDSAMPRISTSGALRRHAATASWTLDQISSASCSIHPGRGAETPTGAAPVDSTRPSAVTSTAFEFVVPWSIARIAWACGAAATSVSSSAKLRG
jgi:hypothetical protein